MPRLPTILVMGSQFISTMSPVLVLIAFPLRRSGAPRRRRSASPGLLVAREQVIALLAPLGLFVRRLGGEAAQGADHGSVQGRRGRRDLRARRLIHEGHELVREARHGARDAD